MLQRLSITLSAALLGSTLLTSVGFSARTPRPNIIVIFTDDQAFNAIGYHNPEVKTPHLDALAAGGIIFQRAYVASPVCGASRASMMTGLFPQQHGVICLNIKPFVRYTTDGSMASQSLAQRLAAAGYRTVFFGKSHVADPLHYGFQEGSKHSGDEASFQRATEILKAQKQRRGEPLFLWIAPFAPHVPLNPKQEHLDLYPPGSIRLPENYRVEPTSASLNNQGVPGKTLYRDSKYPALAKKAPLSAFGGYDIERSPTDYWPSLPSGPPRDKSAMLAFMRSYYAVLSNLDRQVGQFADRLRAAGLLENTVVFFLSDNGYHLGSHGLGNKITMHEESVRVPMFAFGAGVKPGQKTAALVSSIDVYPTLLELAGAEPPPEAVMGKSLLPLLKDPAAPHRETVFSECVGAGGEAGQGHRMARSDRWKLILSDADEEFLFDQHNDPFELTNRRDDPKLTPVLDKLRGDLAAWMKAIGDRPYPVPRDP
ncbi:MAG: sulfatase family protein [Rhizobiaceae bacterium]